MFSAMFVGGYTVGFIRGWQMALVLSAALPLLAVAGFFMMKLLSSSEVAGKNRTVMNSECGRQSLKCMILVYCYSAQKAYSKAGSVAEEVLGSIRTVAAFGAEEKSILRYGRFTEGLDFKCWHYL